LSSLILKLSPHLEHKVLSQQSIGAERVCRIMGESIPWTEPGEKFFLQPSKDFKES
jgi:hypothetical protein